MSLDNAVEIETPERVRFRYRAAGPVRRGLAYLLDLLIRLVILFVVGLVVVMATGHKPTGDKGEGGNAGMGVVLVLMFLLEWGYYVFFDVTAGGMSPGKRVLSLRVVKEGGYAVGFMDSVLRNLLRAADFLPVGYVLGLLVMSGDDRFRRLGDRVAGTMVVVEQPAWVGSPLVLWPPPAPHELEQLPHRPPLAPGEREALELFLRRQDLSEARREELAQTIVPLLAERMHLSPGDPVRFLGLLYHRTVATPRGRQG